MTDRPDLTLFDLDHTLLDGDSNQLWLGWLVERGEVPPQRLAEQAEHYARYQAGTLDIDAYLASGIVALIGELPLVASRCEIVDGRFTGRLVGAPCFAAAKPGCVRDWLADGGRDWADFRTVRFYSDSANDLPLLEAVSEPIVVDADPRLDSIARARGWVRLSWSAAAG
jgi:phosphoserine phosphatase